MGKFDNFKVPETTELDEKQQKYWELCQAVKLDDTLDKATYMFAKSAIDRHCWLRSSKRSKAMAAARVSRGNYECRCCGGIFKVHEVEADHAAPRGYGSPTLDQYVARSLGESAVIFIVCKSCHRAKSAREKTLNHAL